MDTSITSPPEEAGASRMGGLRYHNERSRHQPRKYQLGKQQANSTTRPDRDHVNANRLRR